MKRIKSFIVAGLLVSTLNTATAGIGLSITGLTNLVKGEFVLAGVGAGMGLISMTYGRHLANTGMVGWGAFFFILEEEGMITSSDHKLLANADEATQAAFVEILANKEMSESEKSEALSQLF